MKQAEHSNVIDFSAARARLRQVDPWVEFIREFWAIWARYWGMS